MFCCSLPLDVHQYIANRMSQTVFAASLCHSLKIEKENKVLIRGYISSSRVTLMWKLKKKTTSYWKREKQNFRMALLCCMKGSCRVKIFWKFNLFTKTVRSGIRTRAYRCRVRPEHSALDRSAILTHNSVKINSPPSEHQENVPAKLWPCFAFLVSAADCRLSDKTNKQI